MSLHFKSVSSSCGRRHSDGTNGGLGEERSVYNYLHPVNLGDPENLRLKGSSAEIPSMTPVLMWDLFFFFSRTLTVSEMLLFIYSFIYHWSPYTPVRVNNLVLWLKCSCLSKIHVETQPLVKTCNKQVRVFRGIWVLRTGGHG